MLLSTTALISGKEIYEYKGLVFGEVIAGVNFLKDFGAGLRNFFGGRAQGYEDEIIRARESAIAEMSNRAQKMGANAIIGIKVDYETIGYNGNNMLMVTASGTAVVI